MVRRSGPRPARSGRSRRRSRSGARPRPAPARPGSGRPTTGPGPAPARVAGAGTAEHRPPPARRPGRAGPGCSAGRPRPGGPTPPRAGRPRGHQPITVSCVCGVVMRVVDAPSARRAGAGPGRRRPRPSRSSTSTSSGRPAGHQPVGEQQHEVGPPGVVEVVGRDDDRPPGGRARRRPPRGSARGDTTSSPVTGSSSSSSSASWARPWATSTRWRCPPDSSWSWRRREVGDVQPRRAPVDRRPVGRPAAARRRPAVRVAGHGDGLAHGDRQAAVDVGRLQHQRHRRPAAAGRAPRGRPPGARAGRRAPAAASTCPTRSARSRATTAPGGQIEARAPPRARSVAVGQHEAVGAGGDGAGSDGGCE